MFWRQALYWILICIFDSMNFVYAILHPAKPSPRLEESESDTFDVAEIVMRRELTTDDSIRKISPYLGKRVVRICSDTVVKVAAISRYGTQECPEANCMNFVRKHTSIPVPAVRRTVEHDGEALILMEYVEGQQLAECWVEMSIWQKISVACTLRRYFNSLRALESSIPGPPGTEPLDCETLIFGEDIIAGPFEKFDDLAKHFLVRRKNLSPLFKSRSLVFSHNDLSTRNVLIGTDGKVWLLDWQFGGFYPPWFDPISMWLQAITWRDQREDKRFRSWLLLLPFIFNPSYRDWHIAVESVGFGKMFGMY